MSRPIVRLQAALATSVFVSTLVATPQQAHAFVRQEGLCAQWAAAGSIEVAPVTCNDALQAQARKAVKIVKKSFNANEWLEHEVLQVNGLLGRHNTEVFTVKAGWEVRWEIKSDFMELQLLQGDGVGSEATTLARATEPGRGSKEIKTPGTYSLSIDTPGNWELTVVEKSREITYDYDVTISTTLKNTFEFPIQVSYDFADSQTKQIKIEPGESVTLTEIASLTDLDRKMSNPDLLRELNALTVHEVLNISPEAESARAANAQAAAKAAEKPDTRERDEAIKSQQESALGEYHESATIERRNSKANQAAEDLSLNRDAREADRRHRRNLILWGTASAVVGLGGGIFLMSTGLTLRNDGQDRYDAIKSTGSGTDNLGLSDANSDINRGKVITRLGLAAALLGLAGTATLFTFAFKQPNTQTAGLKQIHPWATRGSGGLVFSGRF